MFDDEIEHHLFDPLTGHLKQKIGALHGVPVQPLRDAAATVLKAIEGSRKELAATAGLLPEGRQAGRGSAHRAAHPLRPRDADRAGFCKGIENYSRHLSGAAPASAADLIDYLPKDGLMFIDESHVSIPQVGAMYKGDRSRKGEPRRVRLPPAVGAGQPAAASSRSSSACCPQTVFVSATPAAYEKEHQGQVVEQVVRPTGLVDPIIVVARRPPRWTTCWARSQRVAPTSASVVTVLTKRMAEDLTGIPGRKRHPGALPPLRTSTPWSAVEIIRDLRLGEFDVLVGINLLREASTSPRCRWAILDADKEGFLRSERSLIQTIGRAARHLHGTAILYADRITDSMKAAIGETERRRPAAGFQRGQRHYAEVRDKTHQGHHRRCLRCVGRRMPRVAAEPGADYASP